MAKTTSNKISTENIISKVVNVRSFPLIFLICSVITCFLVVHESNPKISFLFSADYLKLHLYSNFRKINACDELFLNYSITLSKLNDSGRLKKEKRLPNVIGIGVEKCGTGFIKKMLGSHPMIVALHPEAHFFGSGAYEKGLDFYRNMLPGATKYQLLFEKTPSYFNFNLEVPEMIRKDVPNAKLILSLCDPVNRSISAFVQATELGRIQKNTSFDSFIISEMNKIDSEVKRYTNDSEAMRRYLQDVKVLRHTSLLLSTGMYYYYLENWLKSFNLSDIHIIDGEALLTDPGSIMEEIQEFLNIPKLVIREDFKKGPNSFYGVEIRKMKTINNVNFVVKVPPLYFGKGKGRTRNGKWGQLPKHETIRKLQEFYNPFNQKLYKLLKKNFHWQKPE